MKFKELQVYGFKSFADKLQVKFGAGVTAIVGPNGCGKSNVADAIRWVLGEQSAKLLRGKNMMDVIFSGTQTRKSLSYCEVLLRFDNTEKLFPSLEFSEVTISRKLYRSGESAYFINGTQSRLKEIVDLLHDGGMGREGYSIIGQGRIDELLSAKPENRRAIFEEAAGIAKFKARKIESERKLLRTRENLVRIEDILSEKSRQLEPLTAQSEKARKYLDLRDKLKEHEINIYIYQHDTSESIKDNIKTNLDGINDELNAKESDFNAAMADYRASKDAYESSDTQINSLHEELMQLSLGIEKHAGQVSNLNQRKEFFTLDLDRAAREIDKIEAQVCLLTQTFEGARGEKQGHEALLTAVKSDFEKANADYLHAIDRLNENREKMESERKAELDAIERLSEIKSNLSSLRAERQSLELRGNERNEEIKKLLADLKAAEIQLKRVTDETESITSNHESVSKSFAQVSERNNELRFMINKLNGLLDENSKKYYTFSARSKALKDMKEAYDGFGAGVRNLLKNAKFLGLADKIEGAVAELIKVPPQYETAIEVALGSAYQNVVVKTESDADALIDVLKQKRMGRVTFMPISSAKPRRIDGFRANISEGIFGIASDLISYERKYTPVIEGYLGATVIVKDKSVAIALAKRTGYAFKIVTLEGELIAANGSITGGNTDKNNVNVFSYERELTELDGILASLKQKLAEDTENKERYEAELTECEAKIKSLGKELHSNELMIAAKTEIINQFSTDIDEAGARLGQLKSQEESETKRVSAIDDDLNSIEKLESFLADKRAKASESGLEQSNLLEDLRNSIESKRQKCTDLQIEINRISDAVGRLNSDLARLSQQISELSAQKRTNESYIQSAENELKEIEEKIAALSRKSLETDSTQISGLRQRIADIDNFKKEMLQKIAESDAQREALTDILLKLKEKKTQLEFQLQGVDTDIEAKEERLIEDYGLDYASCLPFKVADYDTSRGINEAARLKKSIYSLGDVNVGAIEQCKAAYEDYNKYLIDRDDLLKGEGDLLKIIKDLSSEMLKLFNENFEKIRVNFVKIFQELFNGGTADLQLIENEEGDSDPLNAGIEIVAQPPEKRLQSITLLSGGERALTAIAILFSILKLKPMPFCVLDEIEAALDDANAFRFAKYLRRFSEETQFIVITHRKPTMELSDSLYGVTMEEKGVSKIVSVKLSDAVAHAESVGAQHTQGA